MKPRIALLFCLLLALAGCASTYVTPPQGVSLAEFTDGELLGYYDKKPASPFPVNLAVLRVQDSDYYAYNNEHRRHARYAFITARDIETDAALQKVSELPLVAGIAPIGRLLLPPNADSVDDLRKPAAQLRADMLLVYTVDTVFTVDGKALGPLSLITLGLLPNRKAHVTATVAGILVDVRSGYIYGSTEATSVENKSASIWSTELVIDTARKLAEERAFVEFTNEFGRLWTGVLNTYAATQPVREPATAPMDAPARSWYRVRLGGD
ncbi:MAG: hypothetical protein KJO31_09010 [Gammaproteobacteria bacterium]|nr:hypothetical protein [Gammaproteobacteria bacterium]